MLDEQLVRDIDKFLNRTFLYRVSYANPDEVARYFVAKAHVAGEIIWMRLFSKALTRHLMGIEWTNENTG